MRDLDALARILGSYFSFWDAWFAVLCPTLQPPPTAGLDKSADSYADE
jgi:hypothetical protein